jgi:hypothetical protein
MSSLHYRLWVAISVSTLAISIGSPVVARPARVTTTTSKVAVAAKAPLSTRIAPPPIDAILDRLKSNPSFQSKQSHSNQHQSSNRKSPIASKQTKRVSKVDRAGEGITRFVDRDQNPNSAAVNQLIK